MSAPDLDRLQEMLGDDWKLTDEQRAVITAWWDAHMSGETNLSLVTTTGRKVAVPAATKRGTRLPEDWRPSTPVQHELIKEYPHLNFRMILDEFRDYWCAVPGQRGLKLSWDRTFRNRVREVADLPRYRRRGTSSADMSKVDTKAASYLED